MSPLTKPTLAEIEADWREFSGGPPVVALLREYEASDVTGALALRGSETSGLVTWYIDGAAAEIVSVHAEPQASGGGSALMDAAEEAIRRAGVRRVVLATTSDNTKALRFYVKRGYRLTRVHLDALERVRRFKPKVRAVGYDGLPLQDMWELEKQL
jgi:ribosomal protein S18 acetylase RimI-like enzyme